MKTRGLIADQRQRWHCLLMCRQLLHEKGVTWKNFKHQTFPDFSYEWLEAELDTGMIPQIWTAKKLLLTFMTNR